MNQNRFVTDKVNILSHKPPFAVAHFDADAFFTSVEQAADRRLRNRPVAVGGGRRGIIACASYEARAKGIYTPMPTSQARQRCPELIILPGRFELYEEFSQNVFGLCRDITPTVEQTSIDEGYLDLTSTQGTNPSHIIKRLRKLDEDILGWLKITVSQGLGANKLISQIASKLHKPHGFMAVPAGRERAFLATLPLQNLPGIGPRTLQRLTDCGFARIGDLLTCPQEELQPILGKRTEPIRQMARGEDDRRILPEAPPAQSMSQQKTFAADQEEEAVVCREAKILLADLLTRLREQNKQARTLSLRLRYCDWETSERHESLDEPSDLESDFLPLLPSLLRRCWQRRVRIRLLAVKLDNFYPSFEQTKLWPDQTSRRRKLARAMDQINHQYGPHTLHHGFRFP
ncbi:MAG: DNA polymerase IV [Opitutales bacterium]|nr:DNA polymerase IV [Opitutales bacterium]MCH8540100.1 DNA polymerase IV [Opitutales bacterium]